MSVRIDLFKGFQFKYRETIVHKLDPRTKGLYVIICTIIALMYTSPIPILLTFITSIILVLLSRVTKEWIGTMKSIALLSIFIFIVNYFTAPYEKLNFAVTMTLRLLTLTSTFSVFFLTTSPEDFSLALLKLGVPYEYTLIFNMAIRFVPTLARDLQTVIDAQKSRGLELEKGNIMQRIRRMIPILVPLLVFEIKRSIMIAEALEARAFGALKNRTYYYEIRMKKIDWILSVIMVLTFVILIVLQLMNILPEWFYWRIPM